MDIPRETDTRKRLRRRLFYGSLGGSAILITTLGLSRLGPAAPTVDRATVWPDTVKRGPVTQELQERFFGVLSGEIEDKHGWLTPV